MTVVHLVLCPDCGEEHEAGVTKLSFCEQHESVLRAMLIQRGVTDCLEMTDEERRDHIEQYGEADLHTEVTQSLVMGVAMTMGPAVMVPYDGCPICALEGTLERAVNECVSRRRASN